MDTKVFYKSKLLLLGLLTALVPSLFTYLGNVDWTQFGVSPMAGMVLGAAIIWLRTRTYAALSIKAPPPPKGQTPFI